jgi:hypothetical protein
MVVFVFGGILMVVWWGVGGVLFQRHQPPSRQLPHEVCEEGPGRLRYVDTAPEMCHEWLSALIWACVVPWECWSQMMVDLESLCRNHVRAM